MITTLVVQVAPTILYAGSGSRRQEPLPCRHDRPCLSWPTCRPRSDAVGHLFTAEGGPLPGDLTEPSAPARIRSGAQWVISGSARQERGAPWGRIREVGLSRTPKSSLRPAWRSVGGPAPRALNEPAGPQGPRSSAYSGRGRARETSALTPIGSGTSSRSNPQMKIGPEPFTVPSRFFFPVPFPQRDGAADWTRTNTGLPTSTSS